jgi:signal transduction histidine kinase
MVQSSLENLEHAPEEQRTVYLRRAGQGAERLRRIVQAMSQAARLEDSLQREPLRPLDLVRLAREYVAARGAAETGHRLVLAPDGPARAPIEGSDELLAQLLDKIVDNAVAFTPAGGRIRIDVRPDPAGWCLAVENEGPSIEPEQAAAIFDSMVRFREHARTDDDRPHLGLGLYIARCIATFHGGRIEARPVAGGTRIEVRLPARPGAMPED